MKRIIASLLLVCFVFLNANFVYANPQSDELKDVLEQIKFRIPSTDEYDEFSSSVNTYSGSKRYRFNWSKTETENNDYASLSVQVNEDGVITSYNMYKDSLQNRNNVASTKRIPSDDVLVVAGEMLKKLNPDIADTLRLSKMQKTESLYSSEYVFRVQRYENDIPVIGNEGSITISSDAKELVGFHINYTDGIKSYEKVNISRDEAVQSFYKNFGMHLKYADDYSLGEKKIILQYEPKMEYGTYISAVDGSVVKQNEEDTYKFMASDSAANKEESMAGGNRLTEVELKEIEKISGLISADDAEKIVRENEIISLDSGYLLTRSNLNRDYRNKDNYIYSLRFEKSENNESEKYVSAYSVNATLEAKTGKILSFNKNGKYPDEENVKAEEAKEKAEKAVKVLAPEHFGEKPDFILSEDNDSKSYYRYNRYVNDIEYQSNYISVGINLADGSVSSYSIVYEENEFISPDGVIPPEEVLQALFSRIGYSVWYLPVKSDDAYIAVPVYYSYENRFIVDAFSSEVLYNAEEDELVPYTDISGHYAEDAINMLAKFGVGFSGGKFNPDENIKQKDYVALLSAAFSYTQPIIISEKFDYTRYYQRADNNGIVKKEERAPESEIDRMDAVVMLVRAIGAEDIAELETIFVPTFADVTDKKGYVAILNGMGVINGDGNGNFNPDHKLSRADAAIILYNYLSR